MTTTPEQIYFHDMAVASTAAAALTTVTTTVGGARPTTSLGGLHTTGSTGVAGQQTTEAPTAQQVEDLNFYLRRMTMAGNSDVSHIDNFSGGADYEMFLDAVNSVGIQYGWTEAQMLRTIERKLKDKAREYYGALLPVERPKSMVEMKQWFRRVFGRRLTINAGKRELERCIRAPSEPLGEYAQRLKVIANKMFPAEALVTPEKLYHRNLLLVNQFIEGLERRLANEILRVGEFHSIDQCLEVAEECEEIVSRMIPETRIDIIRRVENEADAQQEREGNNTGARQGRQDESTPASFMRDSPGMRRFPEGTNQRWNRGRDRRDRDGDRRNQATAELWERFPYMRNRCNRCGESGHIVIGCRRPRVYFCYHCGKKGERCSLNSTRPLPQESG